MKEKKEAFNGERWTEKGKDGSIYLREVYALIELGETAYVVLVYRVLFGPKMRFLTQNCTQQLEPHAYRGARQAVSEP